MTTKLIRRPLLIVVIACFVVGMFSTGSRSAVLGIAVSVMFTAFVVFISNRSQSQIKLVGAFVLAAIGYFSAQVIMPSAFVAYNARSGSSGGHYTEIGDRIIHSTMSWTEGLKGAPPTLFGYGVGVASVIY